MDRISRPGADTDQKIELSIAIQAGGESRRMGEDKAELLFLGKPLITRIAERLTRLGKETIITTNSTEKLSFLDLPLYTDIHSNNGALGGLYTALYSARWPIVAVVACDMPFVSPRLIEAEVEMLIRTGMDVVIPTGPNGMEPMHAVYRKKKCLPPIKRAIERGERRLISWFDEVNVVEMSMEETAVYDPDGFAFVNINTKEDLRRAEAMAGNDGM